MTVRVWDSSPSVLRLSIVPDSPSTTHSRRRHVALLLLLLVFFSTLASYLSPLTSPAVRWSSSLLLATALSLALSPPNPSLSASTITALRTGGVSVSLHPRGAVDDPARIPVVDAIAMKDLRGLVVNEAFEGVVVVTYLALIVGGSGDGKEAGGGERLVVLSPLEAKERDVTEAYGIIRDWMDGNGILLDR